MSLLDLRPYVDGRMSRLPMMTIHVTSACDSRCIGCSYGLGGGGQVLDQTMATELARTAEKLQTRIVFVTGGEPLTVPHLEDLVAPFRTPGRVLYLATSGTRLEERAGLVARLFDEVFVSLDGPDAALHDRIRGVPCFDLLARGVRAVKAVRPLPFTARTTLQRHNIDDALAIAAAADRLGIDRISYLAVDTWSAAFGREGGEDLAPLSPAPEQIERLAAQLPAATERLGESIGRELEAIVGYFRGAMGQGPMPDKRCNTPLLSTVVESDGTVRPCFFKAPLGSLETEPLEAVLGSRAATSARRDLDPTTDPDCQRCVCPKYFPIRELLRGRLQ